VLDSPPEPKTTLWQRALAGAVGGAAGVVNAGGRVRIPERVTAQAVTGIKYPNFANAQRTWEQNIAAAKEAAGLEGQQTDRDVRGRVADARVEASGLAGQASDARAALYRRQAEELDAPADPSKNQQIKEMHDWLVASGFEDQAAWLLAQGKDPRTRQSNPSLIGVVAAAANGDPEATKTVEMYKQFQIDTRAPRQPRQVPASTRRYEDDAATTERANELLSSAVANSGTEEDKYINAIAAAGGDTKALTILYRLLGSHLMAKGRAATVEGQRVLNAMMRGEDPSVKAATSDLPQRPSAPANAPAPGTIEDGYRFKGGDPGDPNNWEAVR
jgi:hypothetical protein